MKKLVVSPSDIRSADKDPLFKKFAVHLSIYSSCEVIIAIASIISFPIFTRIFTKDDYGIMNVVGTFLIFAEMLSSGGLRNSVFRFYGEWKQKKDGVTALYSNVFISTMAVGVVITTIVYYSEPLLARLIKDSAPFVSLASALILFRLTKKMMLTFYRAEEKTIFFAFISIIDKYLGMVLCLLWVVSFSGGLRGFYKGLLIAEGSVFLFLFIATLVRYGPKLIGFHLQAFIETIKYGLPLLACSVCISIMSIADKFLLNYFLGPASVAILSVGYNLVGYVSNISLVAIENTVVPISMNTWAENKYEETRGLLSKFLQYFFMLGVPTAFGLCGLAPELIDILASSKYVQAQVIIPYAVIQMLLMIVLYPFLSGFYFYKKTPTVASIFLMSALLNIGLNIFLIPAYGIVGAALVSTLARGFMVTVGGILSRRYFKFHIPYLVLLRSIFFSVIMYVAISFTATRVSLTSTVLMLFVKFGVGLLTYATLSLLWYWKARRIVLLAYQRLK